jgi:predicted  nucleic acid-binding Zn-ribbon protein
MKLTDLRKLIKEELANIQEEAHNPVDEIGKFFVVNKPKKGMTKENMVKEATVFDDIKREETLGVYKNKSEANRLAGEALKSFEDQLKEVETSMEEYRNAKKAIEEKAKETKEKINKIK